MVREDDIDFAWQIIMTSSGPGDVDDEGSLFSISTLNVTYEVSFLWFSIGWPDICCLRTTEALHEYLQTIWLPGAPSEDIDQLLALYPEDKTQGSPYGTGLFNALTNQSKRIGSFEACHIDQKRSGTTLTYCIGRCRVSRTSSIFS
jgi:hypothetical protein